MPVRHATLLLLALLLGAAAGRQLQAPSPTEVINAQRQAQQQQQAQAAAARSAQALKRLKPPCAVPSSWYPVRACQMTTDAAVCARGWLAWPTIEMCCQKQRGPFGAFPEGCTDFSKELTCWVSGTSWPTQTCRKSNDFTECSRNWGRWASPEACCAPGAAFVDGCTQASDCWVAADFYPARTCKKTDDQELCQRGWGAFASEAECCAVGAAHSTGCGPVGGAEGDGADAPAA